MSSGIQKWPKIAQWPKMVQWPKMAHWPKIAQWPKMAKNEKNLHRRYRRQPCPHMKPGCKYNNEAHSDQSSILDLGPPGPAAYQIGDCCCLGPPVENVNAKG